MLRISSDRDDRIGTKIKTPKKSLGLQNETKKKIPRPKFNPQKIPRRISKPYKFPESIPTKNKNISFEYPKKSLIKSSYPEKYLPKFSYPKKSLHHPCHLISDVPRSPLPPPPQSLGEQESWEMNQLLDWSLRRTRRDILSFFAGSSVLFHLL